MQSIWFAGEIFSTHVHDTSSRPGLFLSARPEFLERGEVFKQKIPRGGPSKKRVSIFYYLIITPPWSIDPFKSIFSFGKKSQSIYSIFCDFFLGNQIRYRGKTEEDCKDLLPSMISLLGTVESSKETEWKVIE